jgi:hypothetical protein
MRQAAKTAVRKGLQTILGGWIISYTVCYERL